MVDWKNIGLGYGLTEKPDVAKFQKWRIGEFGLRVARNRRVLRTHTSKNFHTPPHIRIM